jgi:hypothetical protein
MADAATHPMNVTTLTGVAGGGGMVAGRSSLPRINLGPPGSSECPFEHPTASRRRMAPGKKRKAEVAMAEAEAPEDFSEFQQRQERLEEQYEERYKQRPKSGYCTRCRTRYSSFAVVRAAAPVKRCVSPCVYGEVPLRCTWRMDRLEGVAQLTVDELQTHKLPVKGHHCLPKSAPGRAVEPLMGANAARAGCGWGGCVGSISTSSHTCRHSAVTRTTPPWSRCDLTTCPDFVLNTMSLISLWTGAG